MSVGEDVDWGARARDDKDDIDLLRFAAMGAASGPLVRIGEFARCGRD